MKPKSKIVDADRIARVLGAERGGAVDARAGYFGAMELAADVRARLRAPSNGGRATDPQWTERRLVPLARSTLAKLERMAAKLRSEGTAVEPLQLAAILLERVTEGIADEPATRRRDASRRRKAG